VSVNISVRKTIENPNAIATSIIKLELHIALTAYAIRIIITSQVFPSLVIITSLAYPCQIMVALAIELRKRNTESRI
jgi:hypothetical protein